MDTHALMYPSLRTRSRRRSHGRGPLFLRASTQQVRSIRRVAAEAARFVLALANVVAWLGLVLLLTA